MILQPATADLAPALLRFLRALEADRAEPWLAPGEEIQTEDEALEQIAWFAQALNRRFCVALHDSGLITGYASAIGGLFSSDAHTAQVSVEVLPSFRGQGLGKKLLEDLLAWGTAAGLARLELGVLAGNEAALGLYASLGFQREGTRRAARHWNGAFHDEILMARLLVAEI
jgi:RimJ/RimL family protein N-acetyltransferase